MQASNPNGTALIFTPFDQACRDMLDAAPKRQSRHSLQSAFYHLERAETLVEVDQPMAAFRALTAEEETASGLMHCLKERGYKNAELLKPKDHVQKNAVSPFLRVVGSAIARIFGDRFSDLKLLVDNDGDTCRLVIGLPMNINGQAVLARPIPPLNFAITSNGKAPSYRPEIDHFMKVLGRRDIIEYLRTQANQRNLLLYAGPNGPPDKLHLPEGFFEGQRRSVLTLLRAYLLIQPYSEKLTFVQDALDAFLNMVGSLKEHELHEFL